jgi:membrane-anchored protein YejM (alkaline phosphatase superfamily)
MSESKTTSRPARGLLLRWIGWFGIVNAFLFALVGFRYLLAFGMPESGPALIYIALAFVGQFSVLGFLPMMLLLGPVAVVLPRKGLIMALGVVLAAISLTILVLDTNIFAEYRYHLSRLTVEIFEPSTWLFAGIIFALVLAFQAMLAGNIWQRVVRGGNRKGLWLAVTLILVWFGGQGMHVWGDAIAYAPVTGFTRFMPLYFPMKAKRRLAALGWVEQQRENYPFLRLNAGYVLRDWSFQLQYHTTLGADLPYRDDRTGDQWVAQLNWHW